MKGRTLTIVRRKCLSLPLEFFVLFVSLGWHVGRREEG